jgi:iron complex outermembrane receptor protein
MSVKNTILLLLISISLVSNSQQSTNSLSGKIVDEKSNAVPDASVYVLNSHSGTYSNKQGEFALYDVPSGKFILRISAVGFADVNKLIENGSKGSIEITLTRSTVHLDEVVVSAEKREDMLQQLPFSISALPSKKIDEYRLWDTRSLTAIVPSLYSGNPGDERNVTSIRGITSTSYDPAVATYIDGVNQFNLDTYIPQLFEVERIEVLRGPQGTLYGRNAMGGVINIITKKPGNIANGFASVSIGNKGRQRYNIGLRGPLIKGKLFAGASLLYDKRDGYYTNEFNNTHFDKQHALSGNYYLTYVASTHLSYTLNVKHHINRNNGPFTLVNGVDEAFANPFRLNQNATSKMIDNTFNGSLSANYTGRKINMTAQVAWQKNHRHYTLPLDGDFSPIDGVTIINNYGPKFNNVKVLTEEIRFSSPASTSSPWKWTAGLYSFSQDVPNKQNTHFGDDADLLGSPDKNFGLINTAKGKSWGAAAYGQLTWSLTQKLDITAGLRYDHEHKKQSVLGEYQVDPDPNPVFETRPDTSATANFNAFSPKLSLAYQFSGTTDGYISYNRGFRAGGFTQLGSDPSQPPLFAYKPEYSDNYEIGLKNSLLNHRLRANLSFFYTLVSDAQVPTLILPDAITITRNAGKLDAKGVELELSSIPAKGLEIDYNFGYTDAKYKTLKVAQNGSEQNYHGNRQVFTPSTTSALAAQYSYALPGKQDLKLVVRGEWMAIGKHYFDLANTISQKPYSLFNTQFGITAKNYDLLFWVRNIADEKYISYAYDFGAVHLGDPRTFGVTLTGRFWQ